jgi:hypothetical protein
MASVATEATGTSAQKERERDRAHEGLRRRKAAVRSRLVLAASVLLVLLLSASSAPARGDGSGITVINVAPQFSGLSIRTEDGLNYIDVVVSDYNSWADIFRVRVEVLDSLQASVADVSFQQYPDNVTLTRQPRFTEPVGSYLVWALSSATVNTQPVTVEERTEMRVTFVLSPVKGTWVSVTATDLGGLEAFAEVQYSAGFFGGLPQIPALFVAAFALAAAAVVVHVRIRRDQRAD